MNADTRKRKRTPYICDDILINILRHSTPIALIEFLRVSKRWHALIKSSRLLDSYLPRTPVGVFYNNQKSGLLDKPALPSFRPIQQHSDLRLRVNTKLSFLPPFYEAVIQSHCNGLLVCKCIYSYYYHYFYCICNPATKWCEMIPDAIPKKYIICQTLAFDPDVSLDYELFCFSGAEIFTYPKKMTLCVFSSKSRQWDDLCVLPPDDSESIDSLYGYDSNIVTMMSPLYHDKTLYIPSIDRLLRFQRGKEDNYQVLCFPDGNTRPLGKSFFRLLAKDICYAVLFGFRLRIWTLNHHSMSGTKTTTTKWLLRHDRDVGACEMLQKATNKMNKVILLNKRYRRLGILGFHQHMEMIYLHADKRILAFDPYRSVLMDVGRLRLPNINSVYHTISPVILYEPCFLEQLMQP